MKILLERRLPPCPPQLKCIACSKPFETETIRSLLYDRDGLILGDLCQTCRSADDLSEKLHTTEKIDRPKFYTWWLKRLSVLSEATQEIERARFGTAQCYCAKSRSFRIRFQDDQ